MTTEETTNETNPETVRDRIATLTVDLHLAKQRTASARRENARTIKAAREHETEALDQLDRNSGWAKDVGGSWDKLRAALDAEKKAKAARADASKRLNEAKVDLANAITAGKGTEGGETGERVRVAHQNVDEAEAKRKFELHECLDREQELRKALDHEIGNARQLSLFGLEPEPEPEVGEEHGGDETTPAVGTIRQLKAQARDLGVKGFSKMTKAELVHAIAHAGQTEEETDDNNENESAAEAAE